ncbi:MAG TPA: LptF/LptG family permease [Chryseosolibacter sp.]|nr:LptF/LptG family permease [Chryseosolibacter sp.]
MKLLDKYILKQFLSTFFFVVLILLSVIAVIDMTDKMDKFAKAGVSAGEIASYYVDYVMWIGSLITPITIFIATVYVCSRMAVRTEVIAILSSGVSFMRFLVPFFFGAFVVAVLSFFLSGWIIPNSNKSRLAFDVEHLKSKFYYDKRNIHIQVAPDVYLYLQSYNNTIHTGYHFTMERFENNRLVEKMTGTRIEWDSTTQKWKVRDYRIRKIDAVFESTSNSEIENEDILDVDSIPTKNIAIKRDTLKDARLLKEKPKREDKPRSKTKTELKKPKASATTTTVNTERPKRIIAKKQSSPEKYQAGAVIDTALVIHPKEFESDYRKYEGMTLPELNAYIKTLRARGSAGVEVYQVEKYTRYSSPFTIFILVFMGVIVSSRKSRGGTGLQIALGFLLSFIFILFFMLFRTFAENGQWPPQISVWIPNITFAIISLAMYKYVPR